MAASGRHVLMTHRGEIVAELSPPGESPDTAGKVPPALAAMARRGVVTLAARRKGAPSKDAYPERRPVLPPGGVAELLDDERGSS